MTLQESTAYGVKSESEPNMDQTLASNVLGRLAALVLTKSLKRDYQWEVWGLEMSSAVSRLCILIEEKELLLKPRGLNSQYTTDQVLLLCALLSILTHGRDTTGWCQLILPTPPTPSPRVSPEDVEGMKRSEPAPAAAKLMLPLLQPCLRVTVECVGNQPVV